MPKIFYICTGYTKNYIHLNSIEENNIRCRKLDLYRAMITVGNPSFISRKIIRDNGLARAIYSSVLEKIGVVFENIKSDRDGMRLHPIYSSHVTDKKRIVSYNLGMAFAKYYSEKMLSIASLIHVENLKLMEAIDFKNGGKHREPDLVGKCSKGHWHVFEAKGMSVNNLNSKIASAKEQAQQISLINGAPPQTLSACATYFNYERVLTYLNDPESTEEKGYVVEKNKYVESIYKPLFLFESVLDRKLELRREEKYGYYAIDIEAHGVNLSVGIEEEVYELVQQKKFDEVLKKADEKYSEILGMQIEEGYSLGLDGIMLRYRDY